MTVQTKPEADLLKRFVDTFERLDPMLAYENDPEAVSLAVGEPDAYRVRKWQPRPDATDEAAFLALQAKLPFRLPPLYKQLVLSYRWAEVNLHGYRLLANPPGKDLGGLLSWIFHDRHLYPTVLHHGYLQFAKGEDMDYDPVCFDSKRRRRDGDCPVVKLDHEEILCNEKLVVVKELAPTFRELVYMTIRAAEATNV